MALGESDDNRPHKHRGPAHSSPYPVSRLTPRIGLVDLAREIDQADQQVSARLSAQLQVIADQVKALQAQARQILAQAKSDQRLHHARCSFRRIPGKIYHLYEEADGAAAFSMLSPDDWKGRPPRPFLGSYRLENDMAWTPLEDAERSDDGQRLVACLLDATDGDH